MRQDPYVVVCDLPDKSSKVRTHTIKSGGTAPSWNVSLGNKLSLTLPEKAEGLEIQIWNENMMIDDLIGSAKILLSEMSAGAQKQWYVLDTGGKV